MEQHTIISYDVSHETFDQCDKLIQRNRNNLDLYLEQLSWWNERINLVSRSVSRETIREHIRHSLLLSQLKEFKSSNIIVDAGTGGGLPGIPLAITHPSKHVILNDLVTKKCLAMKQIAQKLGLKNIAILDGSIEDIDYKTPFLLISKHAFKISDLYQMTSHLPWNKAIFYKGIPFEKELGGINTTLNIRSYNLSNDSEFYKNKALVLVERN